MLGAKEITRFGVAGEAHFSGPRPHPLAIEIRMIPMPAGKVCRIRESPLLRYIVHPCACTILVRRLQQCQGIWRQSYVPGCTDFRIRHWIDDNYSWICNASISHIYICTVKCHVSAAWRVDSGDFWAGRFCLRIERM